MWMRDSYPDGHSVQYWNGAKTGTSTSIIRGDMRYTTQSDGRVVSCAYYRNPAGTEENLDTHIAVCSNGVYPYASFPLSEAAR
jgi:hypothetical protein